MSWRRPLPRLLSVRRKLSGSPRLLPRAVSPTSPSTVPVGFRRGAKSSVSGSLVSLAPSSRRLVFRLSESPRPLPLRAAGPAPCFLPHRARPSRPRAEAQEGRAGAAAAELAQEAAEARWQRDQGHQDNRSHRHCCPPSQATAAAAGCGEGTRFLPSRRGKLPSRVAHEPTQSRGWRGCPSCRQLGSHPSNGSHLGGGSQGRDRGSL